jgi:hypothetical protein
MNDHEGSSGVDRRRFLRGAATVAWATPLVLTLGASQAGAQVGSPACAAAANRPNGCPCDTSGQCQGGCCCGPPGGPGLCSTSALCANTPGDCV